MPNTTITIPNALGLHTRASAKLLDCASKYQAEIHLKYAGKIANAKSILDIITLSAQRGAQLEISATGPDANDAINALTKLINNKFGEEE